MDSASVVLVVEDSPEVLEMLQQILRYSGYDVMTARNGAEALEATQKRWPALIITDILMPHMDGFSLVYRLRTDPRTRDIPIILLSATYISAEDKDFATTVGATRFVQKPIDTKDFLKMVAELLKGPPTPVPAPPQEREFLKKYQARLEAKLHEKTSQISRAEQLLGTVPAHEKSGFETSLKQSIQERQSVETELEQVRQYLVRRDQPE